MTTELQFDLPFPPSVNQCWRSIVRGKHATTILSKRGREYREKAVGVIQGVFFGEPVQGRFHVSIDLYPPTSRKFDVDNMPKAILDALTHGGVWEDDSQIDKLEVLRCHKDAANPRARVTITALPTPGLSRPAKEGP